MSQRQVMDTPSLKKKINAVSTQEFAALLEQHHIENPFGDVLAEGLFFPGGDRQALLDQLVHYSRYGRSLTLLLGDDGAGKSVLLSQLQLQMDPAMTRMLLVSVGVMTTSEQLLQQLAGQWAMSEASAEVLSQYCESHAARGIVCCLVLDDADQLSSEALSALMHVSALVPDLHIVLAGTFYLEKMVRSTSMNEFQLVCVEPLDESSAQQYLRYRLGVAGLPDTKFSALQEDHIITQASGLPADLNRLASEALAESLRVIKPVSSRRTMPWLHISALLLVSGLLLFLFFSNGREEIRDVAEAPSMTDHELAVVQPFSGEAPSPVMFDAAVQRLDKTEETTLMQDAVESKPVVKSQDSDVSDVSPFQSSEQALPEASVVQEVEGVNVDDEIDQPQRDVEASDTSEGVVQDEELQLTSQVQLARTRAEIGAQWLSEQRQDYFSIQLLGAADREKIESLLSGYTGVSDLYMIRSFRSGRAWYVVFQGVYPSKDTANAAVKRLPAALRGSVWVRPIADIAAQVR